jgi:hypothetical protein
MNNPLEIVKDIIQNCVTRKNLTTLERAFLDAVERREKEKINVQLDELDSKIKKYGELERGGDYLYISYNSWNSLPYSLCAKLEAELEPLKFNGVSFQLSKFLTVDEEALRMMTDDSVAHLCKVGNYQELVIFSGPVALKMTPYKFKSMNDKFKKDYDIIKSYGVVYTKDKRDLKITWFGRKEYE